MAAYKAVDKKGNEISSGTALHPGELLNDELLARGIKKSEFAKKLGMKPGHLSELLHAKRHVIASVAIKLEKLLDVKAEYWLRIQMYYDLFIERGKLKKQLRNISPFWHSGFRSVP
jgi:HTH-type transcriptional regulator/antitoxin HigA